ncbi:hypothetical protein GQ55_1G100000 [Panicum hallii var. hallii]|uniref:Uncharacterized protein n=1 Tax=Panicum hallii var. hallii TaxID=1504633 RepID=A0A2T7F454_9POAL|nr:hypothetical protein GQ55_1G100000 [Panicum hallii var. hallii]
MVPSAALLAASPFLAARRPRVAAPALRVVLLLRRFCSGVVDSSLALMLLPRPWSSVASSSRAQDMDSRLA